MLGVLRQTAMLGAIAVLYFAPAIGQTSFKPYLAAISVGDSEATVKWYADNLGFKVTKRMDVPELKGRIAFIEREGFTLEIIQDSAALPRTEGKSPSGRTIYPHGFLKLAFLLDDVDGLAQRLKQKGIVLDLDPVDNQEFGVRFFLVKDNSGNVLQFFEKLPAAEKK